MKVTAFILSCAMLAVPVAAFAQSPDAVMTTGGTWSPYLVGALIGILSWCTFYFSEQKIGASSFYATVAGFIGKFIAPKHTMKLAYYEEKPPELNWEFVFVSATILGAVLAATTGGEFGLRGMPLMWTQRHGDESFVLYAAVSLLGGALMAFGARLAGGCTSGHGISGTLQLSVSSWITTVFIFVGGALFVRLLY
ncbi:MAG: YeeE/YedE thiosulfate transporter family protein [Candidatus Melainabacteria bacterium]|nr:YeeE/YedE thiosulfate transporter family protein [Candidatus Melainabacteria bacterium]